MLELTKEEQDYIKEKMKISYGVVTEINPKYEAWQRKHVVGISSTCFCKPNNGKPFKGYCCPRCHQYVTEIYPKNFREKKPSQYLSEKQFFVKNIENGIQIIFFQIQSNIIKTQETPVELKLKIFDYIEIKIGEKSKAFKLTRTGEEPTDLFDSFRINTRTIREGIPMIFQGADNLMDFILKNKDFAKKTGFIQFMNNIELEIPRNVAFMLYLYLLTEYPAIELLVKMNYTKLIAGIFKEVMCAYNKEGIRKNGKKISKIVKDTTKGSLALCVPKFVADYFKEIDAPLCEYEMWAEIFSYDPLSKEHFLKLYQSNEITTMYNDRLAAIASLLKYGYKIEKLLNYLKRQSDDDDDWSSIRFLEDYLEMSSIVGVKPDLFPSNIRQAHDNMMNAYHAHKNEHNDIVLHQIAVNCEKQIPAHPELTIIIPKSTMDFVVEGREQHNCVASYVESVIRKKDIVFFVRTKEHPEESFVTAEYKDGELVQILGKYNNKVHRKDVIDFAKEFCKKLSRKEHLIYKEA